MTPSTCWSGSGRVLGVTAPESSRAVLYTGLVEKLGDDLAERLMTFLPPTEITNLATKDDIARLEASTKAEVAQMGLSLTRDISQATTRIMIAVVGVFASVLAGLIIVVFG